MSERGIQNTVKCITELKLTVFIQQYRTTADITVSGQRDITVSQVNIAESPQCGFIFQRVGGVIKVKRVISAARINITQIGTSLSQIIQCENIITAAGCDGVDICSVINVYLVIAVTQVDRAGTF